MPTGEGYELCSKCSWTNHAEFVALYTGIGDLGSIDTRGAKLYLYGHTYACEPCKKVAKHYGVEIIITGKEFEL